MCVMMSCCSRSLSRACVKTQSFQYHRSLQLKDDETCCFPYFITLRCCLCSKFKDRLEVVRIFQILMMIPSSFSFLYVVPLEWLSLISLEFHHRRREVSSIPLNFLRERVRKQSLGIVLPSSSTVASPCLPPSESWFSPLTLASSLTLPSMKSTLGLLSRASPPLTLEESFKYVTFTRPSMHIITLCACV